MLQKLLLFFFVSLFLCQPSYSNCLDLFGKGIFEIMERQNNNYVEFSLKSGEAKVLALEPQSIVESQNKKEYEESYIFTMLNELGHESLHFIHDQDSGLKSIIAIHNTNLGEGSAVGGTRMWKYENEGEALKDVLRLSEGMTYKSAMANLALGGGKAVILGDSKTEKTPKLLKNYGSFLSLLNKIAYEQHGIARRFTTGEDVGMTVKDMDAINQTGQGFIIGLSGKSGDPSVLTAEGVIAGIESSVHHVFGQRNLKDMEIHVQGLGNVGKLVVQDLAKKGAKISAYDIDKKKTRCLSKQFGLTMKSSSQILSGKCDVFVPCALGAVVNNNTVNSFQCKIIAGSANNQLESPQHGDLLKERGILYAPDYVINAGGVINVSTEFFNMEKKEAEVWARQKTQEIYTTLSEIFKNSEKENIGTHTAADKLAKQRIYQKK